MHPTGTPLHAKESLPINDSKLRLEQALWAMANLLNSVNSAKRAVSLSSGSFASGSQLVSSKMPSSGRLVVGPTTFHASVCPASASPHI